MIVCISNKLFYPQVWVVLIIKEKFVEQIYIFGGSVIWPERVETYPLQETDISLLNQNVNSIARILNNKYCVTFSNCT